MNKLVYFLSLIILFGCNGGSSINTQEIEPPVGVFPSDYMITAYRVIDEVACENIDSDNSNLISLLGRGDDVENEMFEYLKELYNDTSFRGATYPGANRAFAYPFDDITISCDKDFDSAHPADEPLDDIVKIKIFSYWYYINNNYNYPEWYEYKSGEYGLGIMPFEYYLTDINCDATQLLSTKYVPYFWFTTSPDIPGEYSFTLSLTTNGETFTTTFTHTFE